MARKSLRVDPEKLEKVKRAFERTGWTQDELASEVDLRTRQPIGKFLSGKTVERKYFQEICFKLDLDWKEVAHLPKNAESEPEEKEQSNAPPPQDVESELAEKALDNSWDIDILVQKAGTLQVSPDKLEQVKQALENFPSVIQAKGDFEREKAVLQEKKRRQGYLDKQDEMRLNQKNLSLAEKFKTLANKIKLAIQSIEQFFAGEPIERDVFINICSKLKQEWRSILDIDFLRVIVEVVPQIRSHYYNKIQDQCGTLRILDVARPIELDDLYVHVNILDEPISYARLERSDFPQIYNPTTDEFNRWCLGNVRNPEIPGLEVIENHSKLMVLGRPGAGKSTFLQHIAIQCNQGQLQADRVPIFIRLKTFAEDASDREDFSLLHYISQQLDSCGIVKQSVTDKILNYGRALILLDGLDEVPEEDGDEVVKQIRRFCEKYYKNQFIISCRIAAQHYKFPNFTDVEVSDFNDEQIEDFAKKWFIAVDKNSEEEGKEKATRFIEKLNLPENQPIREIAVTPILLILTCLVFQSKTEFPSNRAKLYEEGLEILLIKWDESRGIERDNAYKNLSALRKKQLLSQVAAITFERGDYFLEQDKLQQLIANYLRTLPDANTDPIQLQLDSEAVLKSIAVQHGLLVERAQRIYSFSHLTFQEHFTARAIIDSLNPLALNRLVSHITKRSWREVFLLAVGMMQPADQLLLSMKQQIDELVADDKLQQFLAWVNQKSLAVQVADKPTVRAFYLTFILGLDHFHVQQLDQALNNALVSASVLDDAINYACVINATKISSDAIIFNNPIGKAFNDAYSEFCSLKNDLALAFDLAHNLAHNFNRELVNALHPKFNLKLTHSLQQLKNKLPDPNTDEEKFIEWWQNNGQLWTDKLKLVMIEYRDLGQKSQFSEYQKKLLQQYYYANKLLVDCLNSGCEGSPKVREEIKHTLLLPISESKTKKHNI
ncbi:NACHT domain-containing NTPase [Planktothrix sp. FACHB-1355]|uniref:NACHT domain-containing NTPase n=1 Tax=Aerosakkonema funiforme FACHB-1375 TaxID=2949571 RepID=A0A926VJ12_9CYAN|nr:MULTISPECIES: NACHT domain-containing NTPase [Oscillatoriales]MBD2183389.1 NACHT domain-containing NTPase [Aerosakkonema funiforme FACHB-1375]MBD3557483.1 NACHT domain-containing NTPase [Planktothrix sp. FACHB-1355]